MSQSVNAVEVVGLGKRFRSANGWHWAVRGLDFSVPQGSIFGLLGRNGAGKTTTMQSLVGLAGPDEGRIEILGVSCPEGISSVIARVGAVIEGPNLDPSFSGRRNLEVLARLRQISVERIDEVLEIVDLASRAGDPLASYSLGMRGRLGLAAALLGGPDLLILDEPTNGLDPVGIVATRDLLRRLNKEHGTTILLSSHQLGEVAALCDRVAILHNGCVRVEGTPESLTNGAHEGDFESAFMELTSD